MIGFSASARSAEPEMMDDHATDYDTFRGCLADLATVNRLSFGYRPTIAFLERLRREARLPQGRPLSILDAGSGYGDTLRAVARWAETAGVAVALTGVDRSPWAERAAREATPHGAPIRYVTADVLGFRADRSIDVVVSALFAHHLDDDSLVRFVRWMEATAASGWFVNDLHRNRLALEGFRAASWALRMHPYVRHDGPVSFARAFVRDDWRRTLAAAGVPAGTARVVWRTPFRLCVERVRR